MNKPVYYILALLLLCLAVSLPAFGRKDKSPAIQNEKSTPAQENTIPEQEAAVQVTGIVRLVGNEPFPELVITGQDKEWYIDKNDERALKDLQHRTVTVKGIETVNMLFYANGRSAGERRTLRNITIISIE